MHTMVEKGIAVSTEWLDFSTFIQDMDITYKETMSLDRIDNNLGYFKNNCRWASRTTQSRNTRRLRKDNTSGYRGASWHKKQSVWRSSITLNGKTKHLGSFNTVIEAAMAYDKYVIDNKLEHTTNGLYG